MQLRWFKDLLFSFLYIFANPGHPVLERKQQYVCAVRISEIQCEPQLEIMLTSNAESFLGRYNNKSGFETKKFDNWLEFSVAADTILIGDMSLCGGDTTAKPLWLFETCLTLEL